jgi:Rieske 2Fe-2S family protein
MELGDGMDTMAFPPEALDRPGFDPDYAVKFWDITNRQD